MKIMDKITIISLMNVYAKNSKLISVSPDPKIRFKITDMAGVVLKIITICCKDGPGFSLW